MKRNLVLCLLIFLLLEIWRPCYFLTDDNLSFGYPIFTEIGRHFKSGQSPFFSDYIFGGHYDLTRDIGITFWHPFYLAATLLSDTGARFWMLDVMALEFLLLTTAGFTLLAQVLAREFNPGLPAIYLTFFTMSFVFSTFILLIGSSWLQFLVNQSALPWLVWGILDRKVVRGTLLISAFTIHEILGAYLPLTVTNGLILTLFTGGVMILRRSPAPLFSWGMGNILALLLTAPYLLRVIDGFAHTTRLGGLSAQEISEFSISGPLLPFSLFLGNWSQIFAVAAGDSALQSLVFPFLPTMLACAAAWCIVPAVFGSARWRGLEILALLLVLFMFVLVVRPAVVTHLMSHIPFLKSMRWPFRECLQLLFFFHLFLILRPVDRVARLQAPIVLFSLAAFLLPLPFSRPPSLNPLLVDRVALFSGRADLFWSRVKTHLAPTDEIATIINWKYFQKHATKVPYTFLGTANFPILFRVPSISGYAAAPPADQVPLHTVPGLWFGSFRPDQIGSILAQRPNLKLIRLESVDPLRITLYSQGRIIDLSPYLEN